MRARSPRRTCRTANLYPELQKETMRCQELSVTSCCRGSWKVVCCAGRRAQRYRAHELAAVRQAATQVTMRAAPQKARTVLIWNTPPALMDNDPHKGYCIPYGTAGLQAIGETSRAFTPVVSDDLAQFAPENLRRFDAIVLNNSSGPWITPTRDDLHKDALRELGSDAAQVEAALRQSFLDFVRRGGGVVCLHYAIAANAHWPEFKELFGASFTGHPWTEEVGVTVEDPQHPLVAAFGGADFRITDEIYEYGPPFDRAPACAPVARSGPHEHGSAVDQPP